jgi:hypothetical protein
MDALIDRSTYAALQHCTFEPSIAGSALCPGIVDTPMSRADLGHPDGFASTGIPKGGSLGHSK